MTTDTATQTPDKFDLVAVFRAAAAPDVRDRKFWITLGIALAIHALILISLLETMPRQIGDPNSAPEAVAVSFVSEAELLDATTGSEGGPPPPPPPQQSTPAPQPPEPQQPPEQAQPAQQEAQPPPPPKAEAEPKPEPKPEPKAEEVAKADTETKAPEAPTLRDSIPEVAETEKKDDKKTEAKPEAEKPVETTHQLEKDLPDLLQLPDPATVQRQQQKQQPAKKQQKQAMRSEPNMTMPQDTLSTPSFDGRSAGVQRPPGITRSGANDDFARGVISALRKTMPQMNVLGRVTVRILINNNGNIDKVEVLSAGDNADLTRAIVFSTKQAYFPFPPNGSTLDDRTFTITYIYH